MSLLARSPCLRPLQRVSLVQRPSLFRFPVRHASDLKTLRSRIRVVGTVQTVTRSMKVVAAANLSGLQKALVPARDFAEGLTAAWNGTMKNTPKSRLLVPICSDRGLCGGFNTAISRRARNKLRDQGTGTDAGKPNFSIFPIGNKARGALERANGDVFKGAFSDWEKIKVTFRQATLMANELIKSDHDEYIFVYNKFKTLVQAELTEESLYNFPTAATVRDEIGKFDIENGGYRDVLQNLHEFRFATRLFSMLTETAASECAARMNAMNGSSKAATEMLYKLQLLYNRTRQAKITTELCEIVGGAVAMEG